jgi:hypothetical protein
MLPLYQKDDFEQYSFIVRRLSEKQDLHLLENTENRGQLNHQYHLDHNYSIYQGFIDNIHTHILAHISNLSMIPARVNNSKGIDCSISKDLVFSKFFN